VDFAIVYEPDKPRQPTDLAFNPSQLDQLWVVNRYDDSAIVIDRPGQTDMASVRYHDPDASHFMDKPPALDFGAVSEQWGQTWATCGDSDNGGNYFMGPALFSARLDIFAKPTPDGLGSHLDMLHDSPFCRGIAHVEANVYWVFNSYGRALDKYDFHQDHGPGNDDHSDGEVFRYVAGSVLGVDGSPSHVFYHPDDGMLYVADTGNKRIAKLDPSTGTPGATFAGLEPVATRRIVDGAVLTDVVPPGVVEMPSGLEISGGVLYVTDRATSRFLAFQLDGTLVRTLDTAMPPDSLAGFTFGPDGRIYFVNTIDGRVYRIDPH
jgi:DNA-binding beta-propeller fold protein YncE